MTKLAWGEELETGHALVDAQHQALVELVNVLQDAMRARDAEEALLSHLDALMRHTRDHFETEERLMVDAGYPSFADHKAKHDALLAKATVLVDATVGKGLPLSITLPDFVAFWVRHHIADEDLALIAWMRARGLG